MTHAQDTTPANPAQVTDAMVDRFYASLKQEANGSAFPPRSHVRRALTAAIGAEPEEDTESQWRDLALQFDGHRIQAMCLLRAIAADKAGKAEIEAFLSAPPLSGEQVLADRIAAIGAGGQAVAFASRQSGILDFDVNGAEIINVLLHPEGTLRPENEIPLYTHPAPSGQAVAEDIEKLAWECDRWPDWLHDIVDRTNEVADRLDMSSEQAHAYAALSALSQPHPTDERVVEELREARDWISDNIREGDIAGCSLLGKIAALAQEGR